MIISSSHKKSFFDALGIKNNLVVLFSFYFFFILFANTIIGQTTIHTQQFGSSIPANWTTISSAGSPTWSLINNGATNGSCGSNNIYRAQLSFDATNDDYIITEGFTLTAGNSYSITLSHQSSGTFDVYAGTAQTSAAMLVGTNMLSTNADPGSCADISTTTSFVPTSTGTYYFGFRVRANAGSARLDNIRIYEVTPVSYYSKSTGNLDVLTNWGTNTDGTGTAPSNFTTAAQTFNIRNNPSPTIAAAWGVSGTGSKIVVGDGTNACNFTIPASYAVTGTVDVANNATLSITHLTTNPTLGTLASGSTVDYIGAGNQTIASGSYHHLKLSTSGTKTLIAGVTSIGGNLTTSGTATTTTVVGLTIGGNLAVGDGTTFTNAGHNLTVSGTTTIGGGTSGTLTFSSATNPVKTFTGLVTINTGGNWTESAAITPTFKGGISKSGTFTSSTGVHTFNTNSQSITGALTIPSVTITSVTLTCNSSSDLTVNTALILDATAVLNMTSSQLLGTLTTLTNGGLIKTSNTGTTPLPTAKAWGGTIEYAASGAQNIISATSYTNITVSGSGNKTMDASITLPAAGVLTLSGSAVIVPGAFVLQSDNTTAGAIVGGSSTSFISGALKRKIATGTNTGDWNFPVGIGGSYYPFVLTNPSQVTGYTTVSVTASNSGGSAGTCNASISTSEYWTVVTTTNLSAGLVSLGKTSIGSLNTVSQSPSTTLASAYVSRYGTVSGNSVVNSNTIAISSTTSYFVLSTASSTVPTISTPTSTSVSTSTVTLGGNITAIGCSNVSERGIYYSTSAGFADGAGTKVSETVGPYSAAVFTISVTGLNPSTVYYYKAFATNLAGSVYTIQGTFTTLTPTFPVTEGFESDPSGSFSSGTSTTLGSKIETGSWTNNYAAGGCGSYYLRLTNGVSNQWYFTPLFYATSGKIYTVSYKGLNTASSATVNIYLATAQSSASANLTTNYFTGSGSSSFATETAQGWLCTSSGLYSFGFKVSSGGSPLGLDCVSIAETTPSTITWTGGSNTTDWSTAGNWDLARVPTSSDIIVIPTGKSYYPVSVPAGSYNSLTLNNGASGGTTTINACTFAGALTILSSSAGNTVTIAGTTTVGGNISIGGTGSAFIFNCNAAVTGQGTLVLGNNTAALTSNFSYPITVAGALTLGTNSSNVTSISYSTTTGAVAAIRASNSGSFVFYGAVNYTATSGDQIVMKSQYNGPVTCSGAGNRFMEGDLDINDNLTISGGKWYSGNPTEKGVTGTLGNDGTIKEAISPYKGAAKTGKLQMIYKSSYISGGGIGSQDMLTSISYFILTKGSSNPFKNFTIKLGLTTANSFVGAAGTGFTYLTPTTTVFTAKDVTTVANAWNTHTFDTPFTWDGTSNVLVEITFDNTGFSDPSGTDLVAYYEGAYSDDIIAYNPSGNCNSTNCANYTGAILTSNSNYMGRTIFNIADGPYNINITNNWLNSGGTFYHLTNTVIFDGSTNQNVTTRGDNFYNYTVNNTCSTTALTLLDDNNVEGTATLTDGVITTGSNKLIILSSTASKLTGYSNASFVKGNLRRYIGTNTSTYAFPLGKGTATTDYFLSDIINNNLTTTTYLDGKFVTGAPADYVYNTFMGLGKQLTGAGVTTKDITSLDTKGYTQIDPNIQPGGGSYSYKMYSTNYSTSGWSDNDQCIMKRASSSVTLNDFNQAGTVNADNGLGRKVSDGYLLSTGLTSFSIFEPGLVTPVSLAIKLLDFTTTLRSEKVYLDWTTLTEIHNDYFTIERSSDGHLFTPILTVDGLENSSKLKKYYEIDERPLYGISYYRLKQTDTDGKYSYSQIRAVQNNQNGLIIYPNPAVDNHFQVEYTSEISENVNVFIYDNVGQIIYQNSFTSLKGENHQNIQLNHPAKGFYLLHLRSDSLGEMINKIEF